MTARGSLMLPAEPVRLERGRHRSPAEGMCFTELSSVLAGEPFSDAPRCVSPVVRRLALAMNDRLDDEPRQALRPFALRALGTGGDGRDETRLRLWAEWRLSEGIPLLLDLAGLTSSRQPLRMTRDQMWGARQRARATLRERVAHAAELEAPGAAAAVAAAAAKGVAAAIEDASADSLALVVLDADAATDAIIVAVVHAAGEQAEISAARAVREALWRHALDAVYRSVYEASHPIAWDVMGLVAERLLPRLLSLLERMLPEQPLIPPVLPDAAVICGAPG